MSELLNTSDSGPDPVGGETGDRNMRALAEAITLPPAPTDEQLARWKSAAAAPAAVASRPARVRPRWHGRILAAGSAVAATVALGAVLFMHGRSSEVQAATIIQSLRRAVIGGVNVTVRGLSAEGMTIDGSARVRFTKPIRMESILDDAGDAEPEIAALHAAVDVRAAKGSFADGLDVHFEGASTPASTWAFAKSNQPDRIAESSPARRIMGMAVHGVMVDFGDGGLEALHALHQGNGQPPPAAPPAADHPKHNYTVSVGANSEKGLEVSISRIHRMMQHHHGGASGGGRAEGREVTVLTDEQRQARRVDVERHDQLLRAILSGRAGEAEIAEMLDLLQRYAADAAVERQPDGRYVLKVLIDPGKPGDPDLKEGGMMVRVCYVPDRGVEWAEYFWAGPDLPGGGGAVRIDFADDPIDAKLLDNQRLVTPGKTTIITPAIIKGLLDLD